MQYSELKTRFLGLDTCYPLADGSTHRRIYLDSAASTLMLAPALDTATAFLAHYANSHSTAHHSARIATDCFDWARSQVLRFVHAPPDDYACALLGSGSTSAFNRLAAGLAALRPQRPVALVSTLEHHSNDLPHRRFNPELYHIPALGEGYQCGGIDLAALERQLNEHTGRVNYVAVTGASNVTGAISPLREIAALCHRHDTLLLVDAAQMAAHMPIDMARDEIDFLVFSGHKIYAPGAPGALVGRRDLLAAMPPFEVGGGMVDYVSKHGFQFADDLADREQAGTPNLFGAVLLGAALATLEHVGMDVIWQQEQALTAHALTSLSRCPGLRLYGPPQGDRLGVFSFNLHGVDHGLLAAILNDYYGIAVRNQCFCAHPYVRELLQEELWQAPASDDPELIEFQINLRKGMVRASFGVYTQTTEIDALADALCDIAARIDHYRALYQPLADGNYRHREFQPDSRTLFDPATTLNQLLETT